MSKPSNNPDWKRDFPIRQADEHRVTRRQFIGCLGMTALAGAVLTELEPWSAAQSHAIPRPLPLATIDEIPVGGHRLFPFPGSGHSCILLRLGLDRFAAYDQRCTHLLCPVLFQPQTQELFCPCHHGRFDAKTGAVLAGPPRRPLQRYPLALRHGRVWLLPESSITHNHQPNPTTA